MTIVDLIRRDGREPGGVVRTRIRITLGGQSMVCDLEDFVTAMLQFCQAELA